MDRDEFYFRFNDFRLNDPKKRKSLTVLKFKHKSFAAFDLYQVVQGLGGYDAVAKSSKWSEVAKQISGATSFTPHELLICRRIYQTHLLDFERKLRSENLLKNLSDSPSDPAPDMPLVDGKEFSLRFNAFRFKESTRMSVLKFKGLIIDPFHFYRVVRDMGGYDRVTRESKWRDVARVLCGSLPLGKSDGSHCHRKYACHLHKFVSSLEENNQLPSTSIVEKKDVDEKDLEVFATIQAAGGYEVLNDNRSKWKDICKQLSGPDRVYTVKQCRESYDRVKKSVQRFMKKQQSSKAQTESPIDLPDQIEMEMEQDASLEQKDDEISDHLDGHLILDLVEKAWRENLKEDHYLNHRSDRRRTDS